MSQPIRIGKAIFSILAVLLAYVSAMEIMSGDLEEGFTHGWVDIALAHPVPFALLLVLGSGVFGTAFVAAVDNA